MTLTLRERPTVGGVDDLARRLPDFLVLGAMKAGTTSLWAHLADHPQVFAPEVKEPDFFVAEKTWPRGLDWYAGLFDGCGDDQVTGEASTSYSKRAEFDGVPERAVEVLPDVRLVMVTREPVDRARSMWQHNTVVGRERRPVGEALLDEHYLDPSRYARQLRAWLDHYPREQLLVLDAEDLRPDPTTALTRLADHLGVEPWPDGTTPREEYVSERRRANSPLAARLRRSPAVAGAVRRLPDAVRAPLERAVTRPVDPAAGVVDDALRDRAVAALTDDVSDLRDLLGDTAPAWSRASAWVG